MDTGGCYVHFGLPVGKILHTIRAVMKLDGMKRNRRFRQVFEKKIQQA